MDLSLMVMSGRRGVLGRGLADFNRFTPRRRGGAHTHGVGIYWGALMALAPAAFVCLIWTLLRGY